MSTSRKAIPTERHIDLPLIAPSRRRLRSCALICLICTVHGYGTPEAIAQIAIAADDWRKPRTHAASISEGERVTVCPGRISVADTSNNSQQFCPSLQLFPRRTGVGLIMDSRETWGDVWTTSPSLWRGNIDFDGGAPG
jgi:hypothetical protein